MTLYSEAKTDYIWDDYESIVNIQWSINVRAVSREHAEEQVRATVEHLLSQTKYSQEVADESIEIDIYG